MTNYNSDTAAHPAGRGDYPLACRVSVKCEPADDVQLSCDGETSAQLTLDEVPRTIERRSISTSWGEILR